MIRGLLTLMLSFITIIGIGQVTTTTIGSGSYTDPTNWDNGVPTSSDTAIVMNDMVLTLTRSVANINILSGASVTLDPGSRLNVNNLCDIELGGLLNNNDLFVCLGDYILDGEHSGSGLIRFSTGGNISGIGDCTNTDRVSIVGSDRTILAGSDLSFDNLRMTLFDGITVTNNGNVSVSDLRGQSGGETWVNNTDAVLSADQIAISILLDASATGNTVSLNDNTNITTNVLATITGEYYNLEINGNGNKRLRGDITILNDLTLNSATLQVQRSGVIFDVIINGDWINNGGEFDPSAGNVTFAGSDQNLNINTGTEVFFNVNFFNSGTLTQNGGIVILNDLSFTANYDHNGSTTTLLGDFLNSGNYIASNGTISMSGFTNQDIDGPTTFHNLTINNFSAVNINSGTSEIFGTLTLAGGTLNTNNELVIASDLFSTGRVGPVTGGSINGDVTVQRFFDPIFQGWHQLGVATTGSTLQDWNDDFITTGFPGSDFPTFPFNNVVSYDESLPGDRDIGLLGATNITDPVNIGEGRRVFLDNEEMLIETVGPIHVGDFNFNVTFNADLGDADDGWNLVSNPYASAIDWDSGDWTRVDVNDAIYVWDGDLGLYNSYIAGISTNGGSNVIPSSQAFWIQTNDNTAAAPSLIITEEDKTIDNGTFKNAQDLDIINLYVENGTSKDQIAIVIREDASASFDSNYDAYKFYTETGIPNLASVASDSSELSINSIPSLSEDISIPLKIVAEPGQYSIRTYDDISIPATSCAVIEDLVTGESIPLSVNQSIDFDWTGTSMIEPRFVLHLTASAQLDLNNVSCVDLNDGFASVMGNQDGPWDYTWYDGDGNVLFQDLNQSAASQIENLSPGFYSVEVLGSSSCGNDIINFEIQNAFESAFSIIDSSFDDCNSLSNGSVEFELTNLDESIEWNIELLDGNNNIVIEEILGSGNWAYSDLIGDNYTLKATNACDEFEEIFSLEDENAVSADFESNLEVINLSMGQTLMLSNITANATTHFWDFGDGSSSIDLNPVHEYTAVGTYNVSLTSSNGLCSDTKTIEIEVIDQVTGIDELSSSNFKVFVNDDNRVVIAHDVYIEGPIKIEIVNYAGQIVYSNSISKFDHYLALPELNVTESIYLISMVKGKENIFTKKISLK